MEKSYNNSGKQEALDPHLGRAVSRQLALARAALHERRDAADAAHEEARWAAIKREAAAARARESERQQERCLRGRGRSGLGMTLPLPLPLPLSISRSDTCAAWAGLAPPRGGAARVTRCGAPRAGASSQRSG